MLFEDNNNIEFKSLSKFLFILKRFILKKVIKVNLTFILACLIL